MRGRACTALEELLLPAVPAEARGPAAGRRRAELPQREEHAVAAPGRRRARRPRGLPEVTLPDDGAVSPPGAPLLPPLPEVFVPEDAAWLPRPPWAATPHFARSFPSLAPLRHTLGLGAVPKPPLALGNAQHAVDFLKHYRAPPDVPSAAQVLAHIDSRWLSLPPIPEEDEDEEKEEEQNEQEEENEEDEEEEDEEEEEEQEEQEEQEDKEERDP